MAKTTFLDLESFEVLSKKYAQWLVVNNYSENTARSNRWVVKRFAEWVQDLGITRPRETTKAVLESYKRTLYHRASERDGEPLKPSYIRAVLTNLGMFFRWCTRQGFLHSNPMAEFEFPKRSEPEIYLANLPSANQAQVRVGRILNKEEIKRPALKIF